MNDKNRHALGAVLMLGAIGAGAVWYGWGGFAVVVVALVAGVMLGSDG
jgi:hypothetical protein